MCLSAYYNHPLCGCRWLAIVEPCAPGRGFSTCPHLRNGRAKKAPRGFAANPSLLKNPSIDVVARWMQVPCPVHTLGGQYDRNRVRCIQDVRNGLRWGLGPNANDMGVECGCSVM
ncbi:MAG: hypothetical protein STHCBS139747_005659 [Sporothrix thermara]